MPVETGTQTTAAPRGAAVHRHARHRRRSNYRRAFVQLIGAISIVLALVGMVVSLAIYRQVDRTYNRAEQELQQIAAILTQSGETLRAVTATANQGAMTVDDAAATLTTTATVIRDTATRMEDISGRINFTVPIANTKPLAGVDETFRAEAQQLRAYSGDVDRLRGTLGNNAGNLRALAGDVTVMSQQIADVSALLRQFAAPGTGDLAALSRNFRYILLWSVVMHLMLLLIGLALIALTLNEQTIAHILHRDIAPDASEAHRTDHAEKGKPHHEEPSHRSSRHRRQRRALRPAAHRGDLR